MHILKSNSVVARQMATAIANSLDGATSGGGAILKDTQTTVAKNSHAQVAIQAMLYDPNKFIQAIGQASTHFRTVANNLEAADQAIRQLMPVSSISSSWEVTKHEY